MKLFLLQIQSDSLSSSITVNSESMFNSYWFWVALLESVIILLLVVKLTKRKEILDLNDVSKEKMKSAKSANIDMDDLMNSINKSNEIYKELSKKCHPDRFINTEKQDLAEEIFQEISKNKRNYSALQELKNRAIKELNIN